MDALTIRQTIQLLKNAFSPFKKEIFLLCFYGIFNGLLEGIGVNALIPLFSLVTKKVGVDTDSVTLLLQKFFQFFHVGMSLRTLLILICILFVGKTIILIICNYLNFKITADYEKRVRTHLFDVTLAATWSHSLKQKLGHLETLLMVDVKQSAILLQSLSGAVITLTSLLVYLVIAFQISFKITSIALFTGVCLFSVLRPFIRKTRQISQNTVKTNKQIAHFVNQNITGMKTIKAMSIEKPLLSEGTSLFLKLRNLKIKSLMLNHLSVAFIQPVSVIFISFLFALTYNRSDFNFASLLVVMYLVQRIFLSVNTVQSTYQKIVDAIPYLESISEYQQETDKKGEYFDGLKSFVFEKELLFKDISFQYNDEKPIFSNLNFSIQKGETLGLIGPSGAGKTTIVDLVLRLFVPQQGNIFLDGVDIQKISLHEWRNYIGYVSQDIFLLNDTIENNIRFYQSNITQDQIIQAAKDAAIFDFVQSLPNGFDTVIGDRGVLLSAGQRQRVIIARILARQPILLILDEATSALDNQSESHIQEVIKKLKGKVTILMIAHRLSTVMDCDRLIVLEDGVLIEEGTPQSLLQNKESYFYKVNNIRT